jgi:hypothetical protein
MDTCLHCDLPINPNNGWLCETCETRRDREYGILENSFEGQIINLLPQDWVRQFHAYEALEVYELEDFIEMTYHFTPKENIDSIMELCIMNLHLSIYYKNSPYHVLYMLCLLGANFNGEMYELARSNKCMDSERILKIFCNGPARKIQRTWLRYREWKRNQASQIIQQKVKEWLYRPGGPMMRKFEKNFKRLSLESSTH